jgi:adenosine deaminase
LNEEYLQAANAFALSRAQILHFRQNAVRAAFLSDEDKLKLLGKMPAESEFQTYS